MDWAFPLPPALLSAPPPHAPGREENTAPGGPGGARAPESFLTKSGIKRKGGWKLLTISACWLSSAAPASWSPLSGRAWTSPSADSRSSVSAFLSLPLPISSGPPRSPPAPLPAAARRPRAPSPRPLCAQVTDLHPCPGSRSLLKSERAEFPRLLLGPKKRNGLSREGAARGRRGGRSPADEVT